MTRQATQGNLARATCPRDAFHGKFDDILFVTSAHEDCSLFPHQPLDCAAAEDGVLSGCCSFGLNLRPDVEFLAGVRGR